MEVNDLLKLWGTDEIPGCHEAMRLSKDYLIQCGFGIDRLGTEEPGDRLTEVTKAYMAVVEHYHECEDCQEG